MKKCDIPKQSSSNAEGGTHVSLSIPLRFRYSTAYGREMYYPLCKVSTLIARLCTKTTLNKRELKIVEDMGFDIELSEV